MQFWDNPPSQMGERLKEEIQQAGLDEKTIVSFGFISRSQLTTMLHGSLEKVKGDVLKRLANHGIDINYVFTGIKKNHLPSDEAALIDNYRNTTEQRKASLREVGIAFAKPNLSDDENCA